MAMAMVMAMDMATDMDIMDMAMATTVPTMADTTEATGAKPPSPSKIFYWTLKSLR